LPLYNINEDLSIPDTIFTSLSDVVIYIPTYNCANFITNLIDNIPVMLHSYIECLIIDNCSTDGTVDRIKCLINSKQYCFKISAFFLSNNIGYAGSQKLAYKMLVDLNSGQKVIMLHGDGQYHPELLLKLIPYFYKDFAIVYGFRSKSLYKVKEETPIITYAVIKTLNYVENFITGLNILEWHSGFVMYSINYLSKLPIKELTNSRHIDGELILCAGIMEEAIEALPIYKKYHDHKKFSGFGIYKYVFISIPYILIKYIFGWYHSILLRK
jgi:glycosyltransferase involved in cell wall biosynthesis